MRSSRRRVVVAATTVTLAGLALGAYLFLDGTTGAPPVVAPGPATSAPGVTHVLAPLTGRPVDEAAALDHPAVAVKVSDVRQAHPQTGIDRADLVFVEPIGVSYTRLAAVFHSDVPARVGPVRSVRPMDAALLSPLSAVFGNTMGAGWVMAYVDSVADLDELGSLRVDDPDAYDVDPARPRPDHVFTDPQVLLALSERTAPPRPYVEHAADLSTSSAVRAGGAGQSVVIPYGPGWEVRWTYDPEAGRYQRAEPWGPHVTSDGVRVGADNVVVLRAESLTQKLAEGSGAPVPVLQLVDASGSFVALSGGSSVSGTWSKGSVREPFQLRTGTGAALELAPGTTWFELPGPEADVSLG